MNIKTYIPVVLGIISAKLIGFLRGIFMAGKWGTDNIESDIYFQIFGLVTLIFTGIGIALQTQVIMNLNKAENSSPESKKKYVSSFLAKFTFYLLMVTALLYALARPITKFLLPDFSGIEKEKAV